MGWDFLGRGLSDIGNKAWGIAKLAVPGYAVFEAGKWATTTLWKSGVEWAEGKLDTALANLQIDLALPISPWLSKANSIIPIEEAFHYFVTYLGIASLVLGIKWARNLIPTMS